MISHEIRNKELVGGGVMAQFTSIELYNGMAIMQIRWGVSGLDPDSI